ncbi:MAG: RloB family protein [Sphaerochaetaceae bacterium]
MRIGQPFGQRYEQGTNVVTPKRRFFIACEGRRTEYQYFKGLMQCSQELGISPMVEMIPLRHSPNTGSNPLNIFEETVEILNQSDHYFPDLDRVTIIVDRDKQSFKTFQYEAMLTLCREAGFLLCITNPCFELWLLMHYSDLSEYDSQLLLENRKIGSRTQVERYLMDKLGGRYNKSRIHFIRYFHSRVLIALQHAEAFPHDAEQLQNQVGTGVGALIEHLMQEAKQVPYHYA